MRRWLNVSDATRRVMRANGPRDTGPELLLRGALSRTPAARRYRTHRRDLPGTPDLAFPAARVAVFVDGDFWHGRAFAESGRLPRNNRALWREKFGRNRARDRAADAALSGLGWSVVRVWESDVRRAANAVADALARFALNLPMRGAGCGLSKRSGEDCWRVVPARGGPK